MRWTQHRRLWANDGAVVWQRGGGAAVRRRRRGGAATSGMGLRRVWNRSGAVDVASERAAQETSSEQSTKAGGARESCSRERSAALPSPPAGRGMCVLFSMHCRIDVWILDVYSRAIGEEGCTAVLGEREGDRGT